jgi:serine protease inhibitor
MCATFLVPVGKALVGKAVASTMATSQLAVLGTTTALSALTSIAQAGLSIFQQKNAIEMQEKIQKRKTDAENIRFSQEMTAKRLNEIQEQKAASQKIQEIMDKSDAYIARAQVSAGEAGVTGISVQQQIADFQVKEAQALFVQEDILADRVTASWLDDTNRSYASRNRLQTINQPIPEVDYLSPVFNLAGQTLGIYNQGQQVAYNQVRLNNPTGGV